MKKNFPVKYTSRDYSSIREDLLEYARRYYSNLNLDLNENSLLSFVIDSVAYTGDILSYHTDFNLNESFLDTSLLPENIDKISNQLGYKQRKNTSAFGRIAIYVLIPAKTNSNSPDWDFALTIKKGSTVTSASGNKYIINEDVRVDENQVGLNYIVARVNSSTNTPTYYAVKVYATVVSGVINKKTISVSNTQRFPKVLLGNTNILEVIDIVDEDGNRYYEVPSLTQNVIYKNFTYSNPDNSITRITKPIYALRRFTSVIENNNYFLQFGGRDVNNELSTTLDTIAEPYKVALQEVGKEYSSDTYLEPNKLIDNDLLGLGPQGKTLTITYREGSIGYFADAQNTVTRFDNVSNIEFKNKNSLDTTKLTTILSNIEVTNEETITNNLDSLTQDEYKSLASHNFITQNRAVTDKDYETLIYTMPSSFGSVKRAKVKRDKNSLKNNLNIYVISNDLNGLVKTNDATKQNIKNWLNNYRILSDTIDILDAKIINIGINFEFIVDPSYNSLDVLNLALEQLKFVYRTKQQIGEPFSYTDVFRELRKIKGLLDVTKVEIVNKNGVGYSEIKYDISSNTSKDGRDILIPENCIFEIKNVDTDILGVIK